jgi:hypothetical protein
MAVLEFISKIRITSEGKAQDGEKTQHTGLGCEAFEPICNNAIRALDYF